MRIHGVDIIYIYALSSSGQSYLFTDLRYGISREVMNPEAIGTSIEPVIARAREMIYSNEENEGPRWVEEESVVERALLQQILKSVPTR